MEIPVDGPLPSRHRAKIRTGGLTPDAFPSTQQLFRFLQNAHAQNVPFKATAGLHHAVRSAPMHEFLNFFLAQFQRDQLVWRDRAVSTAQLAARREQFAISFGSCSFEEPISDLAAMGIL